MPEVIIARRGQVSNRGKFKMGRVFKAIAYVRSHVMNTRDTYGYPLRGMDEVGPPPRAKRFEDYMEDETFLQSLPHVIREKLEYLYIQTSIKEKARTRERRKYHSGE